MLITGNWFDGRSSQPRRVMVGLRPTPQGPSLALHPLAAPGAAPTVFTNEQVGWPEAWSERRPPPRVVVDLRDHGSVEIDAVADWRAALAAAGQRPSLAQRMQTRWPVLLAVLVAAIIGLTLFYRYGTPWTAIQLTRFVPLEWETRISEDALAQMDEDALEPSQLPPERQAQLRARFDALVRQTPPALQRYRGYQPALSLEFRAGMGANAFALPGGTVVMTDGIVNAAAAQGLPDDALVGVLAHEIGHVVHRHTTRIVVEQGVLSMGLGLALGNVSAIVSSGASALTGLAYSRRHEREADCYALALMRHAALPTAPTAQLLLAIEHEDDDAKEEGMGEGAGGKAQAQGDAPHPDSILQQAEAHPIWTLLSSHPDTARRVRELEQGHAPHCS